MFTLALAGWRLTIECLPPPLEAAASARYGDFVVPNSPTTSADASLVWRWHAAATGSARANPPPPARHNPKVLAGDVTIVLDGDGVNGTIELPQIRCEAVYRGHHALEHLDYVVRELVALAALRGGGLLVHAAGVCVGGLAYLFIGQSGSGKSTVVFLSGDAQTLSDDLVLIRRTAQGWQAYGTPFWNPGPDRSFTNEGRPVAGVYRLIQSAETRLERLSQGSAVAELVANCPVVNGVQGLMPDLIARCREVTEATPLFRLHFRKDPDFWTLVASERQIDPASR